MSFYAERIFPVINDLFTRSFVRHRARVLQSAHGKILEIGFGSGLSLPAYPAAVERIVGLEPSEGMRQRSRAKSDPRLQLQAGMAEKLPFPDREFDGAVSFLTLCSVGDLDGAIAELRRVLKPNGKLFILEHVAQPPGSLTRKLQGALQPAWSHFACGCQLQRDTIAALERKFQFESLKAIGYTGFPNFLGPIYRGVATAK